MPPRARARMTKATAPRDLWVSVATAAELIGYSRQTVYLMVARRELRSRLVAGRIVVRRADVDKAA